MFYVMEGNVRIGDGSGWFTPGDAYNAVINLLSARRASHGCNPANGGVDPCRNHDPRGNDACRAHRRYTVAIDKAHAAKNTPPDNTSELVYSSAWHDSCIFVTHVRSTDIGGYVVPGVGAGDLAKLSDHGQIGGDFKDVRLCKIITVDGRRARVKITGQCFDGEKHGVWTVPIERLQAR